MKPRYKTVVAALRMLGEGPVWRPAERMRLSLNFGMVKFTTRFVAGGNS